HLDLAAEVQQERPVGNLADLHPGQRAQRLDDLIGMVGVGGVAGDVDQHAELVGIDHVQGGDDRARLADGGGQPADRRGVRGYRDPDGDREPGTGDRSVGHDGIVRRSGMVVRRGRYTCHDRSNMTDAFASPEQSGNIDLELEERYALRRVAGLSTELSDVTEVEYRQLRLERVVLVGVWTEGTVADAENSLA